MRIMIGLLAENPCSATINWASRGGDCGAVCETANASDASSRAAAKLSPTESLRKESRPQTRCSLHHPTADATARAGEIGQDGRELKCRNPTRDPLGAR